MMLDVDFEDVDDVLEELSGSEASTDIDMELKKPEAAEVLKHFDPLTAEGISKLLEKVYKKVLERASALAEKARKAGEDLSGQLAVLKEAYKLYAMVEEYFTVAVRIKDFKVGEAYVRIIGLEAADEIPERTFVIMEGPEEDIERVKKALQEAL